MHPRALHPLPIHLWSKVVALLKNTPILALDYENNSPAMVN